MLKTFFRKLKSKNIDKVPDAVLELKIREILLDNNHTFRFNLLENNRVFLNNLKEIFLEKKIKLSNISNTDEIHKILAMPLKNDNNIINETAKMIMKLLRNRQNEKAIIENQSRRGFLKSAFATAAVAAVNDPINAIAKINKKEDLFELQLRLLNFRIDALNKKGLSYNIQYSANKDINYSYNNMLLLTRLNYPNNFKKEIKDKNDEIWYKVFIGPYKSSYDVEDDLDILLEKLSTLIGKCPISNEIMVVGSENNNFPPIEVINLEKKRDPEESEKITILDDKSKIKPNINNIQSYNKQKIIDFVIKEVENYNKNKIYSVSLTPEEILATIEIESGFNYKKIGYKFNVIGNKLVHAEIIDKYGNRVKIPKAKGLMMLTPDALASGVIFSMYFNRNNKKVIQFFQNEVFNPQYNIKLGILHYAWTKERFNDKNYGNERNQLMLTFAAYNGGVGRIKNNINNANTSDWNNLRLKINRESRRHAEKCIDSYDNFKQLVIVRS